jgi:Sir2- and TIR-associating SLOG family
MSFNKRKTVFISGSAYEYGRFGDEGRDFIRDLTKTLLHNGFKIISGFGYGVGNHVLEGALDEIYVGQKEKLTDQVRIFPFPLMNGLTDSIHSSYRDDMISQAGTAIFLFGNKLEDISVRHADGMKKEFDIAKSYRALLIPVGASGYISEQLWKGLLDEYDNYFDSREKFGWYEQLGDPAARPDQLIDAILQIAQSHE